MDKQEAIKILKNFHDTSALFSVRTALETVFPELKEDEDELEWLKQFIQEEAYSLSMDIRDDEDSFRLKMLQRSLEWLEKQGESIKIKKGKNYLCTKTHKYAGVEWIEGVKYYSPEDYSLVNQGCTCYCPKCSKEEHNNFFKEVEYDGCLEKQDSPIDDNIITHDDEILQAISIGLTDAVEDLGWSDFGGLPIEEIQEWLEKQGEQHSPIDINKMVDDFSHTEVKGYGTPSMIEVDAYRKGINDTLRLGLKLEKQGEQKSIIEMKSPEESLGISSKEYNEIVNDCLYGEEKPANKVKPKFHEGDWVVDSLVGRVKQVQSVDKYGYNFNNGDFTSFDSANENYHLWTIQDARDGNVLVDDCGNVLIYQEPSTDGYCHSYCYCNEMTFIGQGGSHGIKHSHPANQRQRELLFQKMDEAHYKWDAEKRELKKIDTISNTCEVVESESEMAKAALIFIENCKDYFACNGVAKIDVINWFKETFYGK